MKRTLVKLFISATFFLTSAIFAATSNTYTIDPSHSFVEYHINHLGFSTQTGKWPVTGTLQYDQAAPQNSKVNVSINVGDIVTGVPDLDKHLKDKGFFNVAQFPSATFVSNKVEMISKDKAKVTGTLTLHGVSKPITINMTINKLGPNPINDKPSIGLSGTAALKRSNFGMTAYLPALGDDIKLDIEVEANQAG